MEAVKSDGSERSTFGRYKIIDEIGTGGMSSVHLAEVADKDGSTKLVALKRLLPRAAARKELRASFLHEARLTPYLHHPNIAATYDSGKVGESSYIAMEYVPGPTLKELVEHCGATVGNVPTEITLNIVAQVCEALDHAHNRCDEHGKPLGIIHRDISPANIILSESGLVKLIDFGLAKAKISSTGTAEGMIKGKFNYVAPEYLGGKLDARADLWALGVVMYELLTSRRLFDAPDDFETMTRVRKLPIPAPSRANPRVTPELDAIVMNALARNPAKRWQTAAMMRDALRGVIAQPGNCVDNRHVIDWVNWVFTQKPGTEASGVSKLLSITKPMRAVSEPAPGDTSLRRGVVWLRRILGPRSRP
jgi:serine/threonine protein kinase